VETALATESDVVRSMIADVTCVQASQITHNPGRDLKMLQNSGIVAAVGTVQPRAENVRMPIMSVQILREFDKVLANPFPAGGGRAR